MARGLAKRNRPTAVVADDPLPPAVEDDASPEPEPEDPEPEQKYKKSALPPDKIAIRCVDCGSERAKYVEDAGMVGEAMRKEMFDKNGSYDPPLCGFCLRVRQRKARKSQPVAA